MICNVGWLSGEKSGEDRKKIIILMSDGEMHYALDGLLGGITNNFDIDKCSSKISGYHASQFDYPSFGQVRLSIDKILLRLLQ